jgi:dTDP-4-dehydrorhamnose 3,5-epimerase
MFGVFMMVEDVKSSAGELLEGVASIKGDFFGDERGYFYELWRASTVKQITQNLSFVQSNVSRSAKGVLRGMHYQLNQPQGKWVQVLQGQILDVMVDMRSGSPTQGQWGSMMLSDPLLSENEASNALWVPPGFAHGFLAISDQVLLQYQCTDYYAPEDEIILDALDPKLAIAWPGLDVDWLRSEKDACKALGIDQAPLVKLGS